MEVMSDLPHRAREEDPAERPPLDPVWAASLKRLALANEKVHRERLKAFTIESSLREFEELNREVHELFEGGDAPRTHPVGLIKYYRAREKDSP